MDREIEPTKPSIIATLLWTFGIFIIALTVYSMVNWRGWTENLHDIVLVFVAFSSGVNAIATGALIDMHPTRYKQKSVGYVEKCARVVFAVRSRGTFNGSH